MHASTPLLAAIVCLWADPAQAHHFMTYPGTRGNNLIINNTFPFGMQWMYPCGGMPVSQNRTYWPVGGDGAVAVQPGWFSGGLSSLFYINMGFGAEPSNYSFPMVPLFRVSGPTNNPYPGTFCLPQVPLPEGARPQVGDLASIQIVQTHIHGAPAYSCVDIIFTNDNSKLPELSPNTCFNTTTVRAEHVRVLSDAELARAGAGAGSSITTGGSPSATRAGAQDTAAPSPTSGARRLMSRVSGLVGFLATLL